MHTHTCMHARTHIRTHARMHTHTPCTRSHITPRHSWLCHVDDDIYVILPTLVKTLSKFDPKTEPVYFGRAFHYNSSNVGGIPYKNLTFDFAPGCMYCLSRPMLQEAKELLV